MSAPAKCYCGHARRTHVNDGRGICLSKACGCLIYRPDPKYAATR